MEATSEVLSGCGQVTWDVRGAQSRDRVTIGYGDPYRTTWHCTTHGYRCLSDESPCRHMRAVVHAMARGGTSPA